MSAVPLALALDAAQHTLIEVLDLKLRLDATTNQHELTQLPGETVLIRTATELILGSTSVEYKTDSNTGWEWREVAVGGRPLYRQGMSRTDYNGYELVRLLDYTAIYAADDLTGVILL